MRLRPLCYVFTLEISALNILYCQRNNACADLGSIDSHRTSRAAAGYASLSFWIVSRLIIHSLHTRFYLTTKQSVCPPCPNVQNTCSTHGPVVNRKCSSTDATSDNPTDTRGRFKWCNFSSSVPYDLTSRTLPACFISYCKGTGKQLNMVCPIAL